MADKPKPPYSRYAFRNPYNYAVMGGFASAAVLTGNWWLGLAGAGVEALWMLFAPDSRLLQKTVWDKRHQAEELARMNAELDAKFRLLPDAARARCLALRENKEQINKLADENPAFTQDLLTGELKKLEDLVKGLVELSVTGARYQEYLGSVNLDGIERDLKRYQTILDQAPADSDKHTLAQKNIAVLQKLQRQVRRNRYETTCRRRAASWS